MYFMTHVGLPKRRTFGHEQAQTSSNTAEAAFARECRATPLPGGCPAERPNIEKQCHCGTVSEMKCPFLPTGEICL